MRDRIRRYLVEWATIAQQTLLAWERSLHTMPPAPAATVPVWRLLLWGIVVAVCVASAGSLVGYSYFWGKWKPVRYSEVQVRQWEKASSQVPTDPDTWMNLGYAYFQKGEYARAERAYRRAAELTTRNESIHYFIGLAQFERRDYRRAEESFRRVAEAFPLNPLGIYQLAATYLAEGRAEQAILKLDHIIRRIDPTLADVYELRGKAYEATGDRARARADYQQGIRMDPSLKESRRGLLRLGVSEKDLPPADQQLSVVRRPPWWERWLPR